MRGTRLKKPRVYPVKILYACLHGRNAFKSFNQRIPRSSASGCPIMPSSLRGEFIGYGEFAMTCLSFIRVYFNI